MIELPETLVVVILAVVQGVTEFLPISSSGHLVILSELLGKEPSTELNVFLHGGTLLSILVFYRERIIALLTSDRRVAVMLVVATIPAASVGLLINFRFPEVEKNPLLAGFMLVITGFVLMGMQSSAGGTKDYRDVSPLQALWIGIFQAFALLPGVSRSGMTIFAGQVSGLRPDAAATFSFLVAIPAILGAMVLKVSDMGSETAIWQLLLGVVISFGVGLLALRWLVKLLHRSQVHLFAYWVIPIGFAVVVWQLYRLVDAI